MPVRDRYGDAGKWEYSDQPLAAVQPVTERVKSKREEPRAPPLGLAAGWGYFVLN